MKAKYKISTLIKAYREEKNTEEYLLKIIECMRPIINKYAHKIGENEYEDAQQELTLAILESLEKMKCYDNEGQCIMFIVNAVRNRFFELSRKKQNTRNMEILDELTSEMNEPVIKNSYGEVEFWTDLSTLIKCKSELQKAIAYFTLSESMTDQEIASRLHISRQYVNRCKKMIFHNLKSYV
nr:hypothetical protein [uncultured Lachnoclostridium sp.]